MAESITTQIQIQRWRLKNAKDLWKALEELEKEGYRGAVRVSHDEAGFAAWDLELSKDGVKAIQAAVGDILVLSAGDLQKLTDDDFVAKFGEV